jgi:hypothetical protein
MSGSLARPGKAARVAAAARVTIRDADRKSLITEASPPAG